MFWNGCFGSFSKILRLKLNIHSDLYTDSKRLWLFQILNDETMHVCDDKRALCICNYFPLMNYEYEQIYSYSKIPVNFTTGRRSRQNQIEDKRGQVNKVILNSRCKWIRISLHLDDLNAKIMSSFSDWQKHRLRIESHAFIYSLRNWKHTSSWLPMFSIDTSRWIKSSCSWLCSKFHFNSSPERRILKYVLIYGHEKLRTLCNNKSSVETWYF